MITKSFMEQQKQLDFQILSELSNGSSNQNNLVPLCNSCHSKTNGSREKWMKYFEVKLNAEIKC